MARTLLESLLVDDNQEQQDTTQSPQGVEVDIISIASDLHIIMEEAMTAAKAIFPQKSVAPKRTHFPMTSGPNLSDMMLIKSASG
jgi:hypothetical protein